MNYIQLYIRHSVAHALAVDCWSRNFNYANYKAYCMRANEAYVSFLQYTAVCVACDYQLQSGDFIHV